MMAIIKKIIEVLYWMNPMTEGFIRAFLGVLLLYNLQGLGVFDEISKFATIMLIIFVCLFIFAPFIDRTYESWEKEK
jgi:amino acid permease